MCVCVCVSALNSGCFGRYGFLLLVHCDKNFGTMECSEWYICVYICIPG